MLSSEGKKSDAWVEDRNNNEMHFTKRKKQSIRRKSEANFKSYCSHISFGRVVIRKILNQVSKMMFTHEALESCFENVFYT